MHRPFGNLHFQNQQVALGSQSLTDHCKYGSRGTQSRWKMTSLIIWMCCLQLISCFKILFQVLWCSECSLRWKLLFQLFLKITNINRFIYILFKFIFKERDRERNTDWLASARTHTEDRAGMPPTVCPHWDWNWKPFCAWEHVHPIEPLPEGYFLFCIWKYHTMKRKAAVCGKFLRQGLQPSGCRRQEEPMGNDRWLMV